VNKSTAAKLFIAFLAITAGWFVHPPAHGQAAKGAASPGITLTIFGAGTLAAPFRQIDDAVMQQHPNITIQAQFGGSVKMVKQVTELGQIADVVAVADYSVIPKYLFGDGTKYTDWYAGFATNAITFVYTDKSKFAGEITAQNWYEVLSRPGVQIGRSNPDTDPSGYQTVQMLELAEKYYKRPALASTVLANAPKSNMRDTETELIAALESGQIDYLAIYRSDALQNHLKYINLPPQISLSDPKLAKSYATVSVQGPSGMVTGKPIIYGLTVPSNAPNSALGEKFIAFVLSPSGQAIMRANGFVVISPALASSTSAIPASLSSLTRPWPK